MTTTLSPSATAASVFTPPTSSEDEAPSWAYQFESAVDDPPRLSNNGQPHDFHLEARKMHSADNLTTAVTPPSWPTTGSDRPPKRPNNRDPNESKWIHRDKLAKIESEELEAAGIFVPPSRLLAKQRRERSQSQLARGTDNVDLPSKSSTASESASPSEEPFKSGGWDPRTPAEVAQEGQNAYFVAGAAAKGGSRIPVAKLSPAPIPLDYLERGSQAVRRHVDGEGDALLYQKPRSRSASLSVSEAINGAASGVPSAGRRSVTDTSPKKNAPRKLSAASKTSTTVGRPKTRSGPSKDATRAFAKAGEPSAAGWAPAGDPPWMANSYSPDPRLPPDQQLLPTVARRLQQEQWEKEGKFGDAYDREFRPLNVHELPKPSMTAPKPGDDDEADGGKDSAAANLDPLGQHPAAEEQATDEWPLRHGAGKTLNVRQGSYSTMPKISDAPSNVPLSSPRAPVAQSPPAAPQTASVQRVPDLSGGDDEKRKAGCRCCIVM
ncbi:hypothetical protein XA68_13445 [Ophiocordyceps unilateralis]|uniref:TeaA receptor TeaR n=1 Tax=Ophiocordyceps unilateralis TaxID=268505 RepID=A0A2A9PBF9_OPHUN|nr:hypothetical protein XA68_13445 [Ophiocordyceps unilateralis]